MPDDPRRPGDDDGDGDITPEDLEDWIGGRDDDDADEPQWDYEAEHPESVIPQLDHDGVLSGLEHPPSPARLEREAAARAEVERENAAERAGEADTPGNEPGGIVFDDEISRVTRDLEEMILVDEEAAEEARRQKLVEEALEEQRRLLEEIEAPKRAAAEAEAERQREAEAEKKYQLDLSWRRLAAGIALFAGLGYGCTQLLGDDGDTAANNDPSAEREDDGSLVAVNDPGGDGGEGDDGDPEETPQQPDTPSEPETETAAATPPGSGMTETVGFIDSACAGFYEVFLRILAFNNFQVSVEQLSTEGGQGFETTNGWSNDRVALTSLTEGEFLQLWFFVWTASDLFAVYNVFGPVGDFVPPESPDDLEKYESVGSADDLVAVTGVGEGACGDEVQDLGSVNSSFPG